MWIYTGACFAAIVFSVVIYHLSIVALLLVKSEKISISPKSEYFCQMYDM